MITFANKAKVGWRCFALALLAVGCGGRVTSDGADPGSDDTPPPTCEAICRHVVDSCFPGASTTQCARDCETMRTDYMGCKALDTFLSCNSTAPVLCTDNKATIDGCYAERNELSRCKS